MNKLFFALMIKHAFCDLYFQNRKSPIDKSKYIGECHVHYFDHFLATFLVCFMFKLPLDYCFFLSSVDYFLHWHIDFIKTNIVKLFKVNTNSIIYWLIQTFDQILHYSTYFLIVYLACNVSFEHILKEFVSIFY